MHMLMFQSLLASLVLQRMIWSYSEAKIDIPIMATQSSSRYEPGMTESFMAVDDSDHRCAITKDNDASRWWAGKLGKKTVVTHVELTMSLKFEGCAGRIYKDKCVLLENQKKKWYDAVDYCESEHGGSLITVLNREDLNLMFEVMGSIGAKDIWINMKVANTGSPYTLSISNGTILDNDAIQPLFASGDPNEYKTPEGACVRVVKDDGLRDRPCNTAKYTFPFVCATSARSLKTLDSADGDVTVYLGSSSFPPTSASDYTHCKSISTTITAGLVKKTAECVLPITPEYIYVVANGAGPLSLCDVKAKQAHAAEPSMRNFIGYIRIPGATLVENRPSRACSKGACAYRCIDTPGCVAFNFQRYGNTCSCAVINENNDLSAPPSIGEGEKWELWRIKYQ